MTVGLGVGSLNVLFVKHFFVFFSFSPKFSLTVTVLVARVVPINVYRNNYLNKKILQEDENIHL